jgi:hypothetical protein
MPYIPQSERNPIDDGYVPITVGQLNYAITRLIANHLTARTKSYSNINEVIGVLECAKLELYRRIAVPYESAKLEQNGDVY